MLPMENVFELLKNAAKSHPNAVVFADSTQITYLEALDSVERVACYIHSLGIRHERILVNVGRDYKTLLLFLGIALSGNCYVPNDASYPESRKRDIVEIGDIRYGFDAGLVNNISSEKALSFPKNDAVIAELEGAFNGDEPLYLMFTSGSTGKPKGVLKSHRNVLAFVSNFEKTFDIPHGVRFCNQTPFSFDASAKDIYLTLALEGVLFIPDKSKFALPKVIVDYLNENGIQAIMWVPSALTNIAKTRTLNFVKPWYLRYVFFIGEVFPPKYLNMWTAALPNVHFFNLYGSTEIAGACLYHEVKGQIPLDSQLPLGKPLYGNDVMLQNREICVCSEQVSIGYYGDEERNRKAFFIEDGDRFLRTGDYGEINADRDFVFRTRMDFQIKHMGYRIELQDIEVSLSSLEYLADVCCVYDDNKDKVVLFATLNKEVDTPEVRILSDARDKLPYYMVPNVVKVLSSMPLNANGKIDRTGLKNGLQEK